MTNEEAIRLIDDMRRNAIGLMLEKKQIDALDMAIEALKAQDDSLDEWCTDCKEYDQENHCCPRFNRVISETLKEVQSGKDINVRSKDTVYRQALLDAFGLSEKTRKYGGDHSGYNTLMLYEIQDVIEGMPSAEPDNSKYEYHYDHTDCIWYRPEARNRCPSTCAQYRDGWNDAMNYIFRDGEGYRPYRRDKTYE